MFKSQQPQRPSKDNRLFIQERMNLSSLWTEKYRPKHLHEVSGQHILKDFLQRLISNGIQNAPHLILHGPPGTGKTTMAMAFAADMYPTVPYPASTMYLNSSDERTMETVRERIREFLKTHWVGVGRKIVIFDEVETMTEAAQLTLRALMDSPLVPGAPLPLFIFLCNTLSRIVPLIRSRALALYCGHLTSIQIRELLEDIQEKEKQTLSLPTPLACLLNRGDMRAFLQRAQQGSDANMWLPWFQRLLNTSAELSHFVWEDGLQQVPIWVLLRHVLLFFYSMGLIQHIPQDLWKRWLQFTVQIRSAPSSASTIQQIQKEWSPVIQSLQAKK
jgi:hypothetical protein